MDGQRPLRVLLLAFVAATLAAALAASWFFVAFPSRFFDVVALRDRGAGRGDGGEAFISAATLRECERRTRVRSGTTDSILWADSSGRPPGEAAGEGDFCSALIRCDFDGRPSSSSWSRARLELVGVCVVLVLCGNCSTAPLRDRTCTS